MSGHGKASRTIPNLGNDSRPTVNVVSRMVVLASGGSVALVAEVDVWRMSEEDRAFLGQIVDAIDRYEQAAKAPKSVAVNPPGSAADAIDRIGDEVNRTDDFLTEEPSDGTPVLPNE